VQRTRGKDAIIAQGPTTFLLGEACCGAGERGVNLSSAVRLSSS